MSDQQLVALVRAANPSLFPDAMPVPPLAPAAWAEILTAASRHGLVGLLDGAIAALKRDDVPPAVADTLRATLRSNTLAAGMANRLLGEALDAAQAARVPLAVLKGAALARVLYPAPELRPFGDVDALIRQRDAAGLEQELERRGFVRGQELAIGFQRAFDAEMRFHPADSEAVFFDLHWGLVSPMYYRKRIDDDWFWKNTESCTLVGRPACTLNPTAQLVQLGAHAGLHHQDQPRLIWLYDLVLLLARRGDEIDWAGADALAKQARLTRPLRWVLDQMQAWWSVPLPPQAANLFQPPQTDLAERAVYALTTSPLTEARTLADVLSTPGTQAKTRFVRQHLFPNAAYMRTRYGFRRDALLPLYYARRLVESAFKFTRSLWVSATR